MKQLICCPDIFAVWMNYPIFPESFYNPAKFIRRKNIFKGRIMQVPDCGAAVKIYTAQGYVTVIKDAEVVPHAKTVACPCIFDASILKGMPPVFKDIGLKKIFG